MAASSEAQDLKSLEARSRNAASADGGVEADFFCEALVYMVVKRGRRYLHGAPEESRDLLSVREKRRESRGRDFSDDVRAFLDEWID